MAGSPLQATLNGGYDAFVAKLNADGSALVYATYLGGSQSEEGQGLAVDATGHAYVTGWTTSPDFPVAGRPVQAHPRGGSDAFVVKLNAAGSALVYATYLGGSSGDSGKGIAVDAAGHAYVMGFAGDSPDFPVAGRPVQAHPRGGRDVFVVKLNAAGSALVYATYLGGSRSDFGEGFAVDAIGQAYVTGFTDSFDFPVIGSPPRPHTAARATPLWPRSGQTLYHQQSPSLPPLTPCGHRTARWSRSPSRGRSRTLTPAWTRARQPIQ